MATPIQQNLHDQNTQYANTFDQGHLALPPAKKYLVRMSMDNTSPPQSLPEKKHLNTAYQ